MLSTKIMKKALFQVDLNQSFFPFSALTQRQKKKKIPTPEKTHIHSRNKVHGALTVFMWMEKGDMQRAPRASFHLFTGSGTIILP